MPFNWRDVHPHGTASFPPPTTNRTEPNRTEPNRTDSRPIPSFPILNRTVPFPSYTDPNLSGYEHNNQCWGYGNYGQLGQGTIYSYGNAVYTMGDYLEPVDLGNGTAGEPRKAAKAAAGKDYTCVLSEENEVVCFGHNDMGQLGVDNSKDVGKLESQMGDALVPVDFGSGSGYAVDISSGPCALLSDGTVKVRVGDFRVVHPSAIVFDPGGFYRCRSL